MGSLNSNSSLDQASSFFYWGRLRIPMFPCLAHRQEVQWGPSACSNRLFLTAAQIHHSFMKVRRFPASVTYNLPAHRHPTGLRWPFPGGGKCLKLFFNGFSGIQGGINISPKQLAGRSGEPEYKSTCWLRFWGGSKGRKLCRECFQALKSMFFFPWAVLTHETVNNKSTVGNINGTKGALSLQSWTVCGLVDSCDKRNKRIKVFSFSKATMPGNIFS